MRSLIYCAVKMGQTEKLMLKSASFVLPTKKVRCWNYFCSSMGSSHSQAAAAANSNGNAAHENGIGSKKNSKLSSSSPQSKSFCQASCESSSAASGATKSTAAEAATKSKWKQLARSAFNKNRLNSHRSRESSKEEVNDQNRKSSENNCSSNNSSFDGSLNGTTKLNLESCLSDSLRKTQDLTLLQILALKSLELTAPASDIILKNRSKNWVQCSGHENSFSPAAPGTIWKKRGSEDAEVRAYEKLMNDSTRDVVPKYYGTVEYKDEYFIEMQDLLYSFNNPSIMDIKMGTRTFLESEVKNSKPRPDLYEKMIKIDPEAPQPQEHEMKAVTKLRYMQFRENLSSSSNLGFRIEGFKAHGKNQTKDLQFLKQREEIKSTLSSFLPSNRDLRQQVLQKLKEVKEKFEQSDFFKSHEVIGSSLLFIYDETHAGVWMIDFAKTVPLPENVSINHVSDWVFGNHEDGYLFGLNNLISIMSELV